MTNIQEIESLLPALQQKYRDVYEAHPLKHYIDWESYFNSDDGNEMHFLGCEEIFIDEDDMTNIILEYFIDEEGVDYKLIYVVEEDSFYEIPAEESEIM